MTSETQRKLAREFDNVLQELRAARVELRKLAREFDNVDHNGDGNPSQRQVNAAVAIMAKARELRRILRS